MDIDKKGIFQSFPEAVSFEKKIQSIFRRNPGKTKTIGLGDISINKYLITKESGGTGSFQQSNNQIRRIKVE